MKRTSLGEWCKDAGPIGPALWVFDGIVDTLAGIEVEDPKPREPDENAESLGLVLMLSMIAAVMVVVALIVFFPH